MKAGKWLGILLVSALALGGCGSEVAQETIVEVKESALNAPQTAEVVKGDITKGLYYDAQVGPRVVQLGFEKGGTFGEFFVELGDEVKE